MMIRGVRLPDQTMKLTDTSAARLRHRRGRSADGGWQGLTRRLQKTLTLTGYVRVVGTDIDRVILYANYEPGGGWQDTLEEIARKLLAAAKRFEARTP